MSFSDNEDDYLIAAIDDYEKNYCDTLKPDSEICNIYKSSASSDKNYSLDYKIKSNPGNYKRPSLTCKNNEDSSSNTLPLGKSSYKLQNDNQNILDSSNLKSFEINEKIKVSCSNNIPFPSNISNDFKKRLVEPSMKPGQVKCLRKNEDHKTNIRIISHAHSSPYQDLDDNFDDEFIKFCDQQMLKRKLEDKYDYSPSNNSSKILKVTSTSNSLNICSPAKDKFNSENFISTSLKKFADTMSNSVVKKRKFPGPAGLLPKLVRIIITKYNIVFIDYYFIIFT